MSDALVAIILNSKGWSTLECLCFPAINLIQLVIMSFSTGQCHCAYGNVLLCPGDGWERGNIVTRRDATAVAGTTVISFGFKGFEINLKS